MDLKLLKEAGVLLRLEKCAFFSNYYYYFGNVIKPGLLEVFHNKADAIREVNVSTKLSELRPFIGQCNVFTRFVRNFESILSPLSKRLKKAQDRKLRPPNKKILNTLKTFKEKLISRPVPTPSKRGVQYHCTLAHVIIKPVFHVAESRKRYSWPIA